MFGESYQKQTVNQQMYKSPLTPIPRKDIQDKIENRRSDIFIHFIDFSLFK